MTAFPVASSSLAAGSSAVGDAVPNLLEPFALTVALSFLVGLALREYYQAEEHVEYFGSVRTYTFIGMLGFGLYHVSALVAYTAGFAGLAVFLAIYYWRKSAAGRPGMIGMMSALLTYLFGPLALTTPAWFAILFAVLILFAVNAKERIRLLSERITQREVVTAATFLTLAGVILPLLPHQLIAPFVPLTPYQVWLAVVVSTGFSYASYLLQTYIFPRKGLLLSGFLGGLYSSTVTTFVIAQRTREYAGTGEIAGALVAATAMMYLRMIVLIAIFDGATALRAGPLFASLAVVTAVIAHRMSRRDTGKQTLPVSAALQRNPLELTAAALFAALLVVMATATHFAMAEWPGLGLQGLAVLAGITEIEPFVISLLQMRTPIAADEVVNAVVLATAANNLLKIVYAMSFAKREAGLRASLVLFALAAVSAVYVLL